MNVKAKPFVKWAGGKGQLIRQLDTLLPNDLLLNEQMIYVEPFVGGGAMLFYVLSKYTGIKQAVINDINTDLILCYKTIKDNPEELIDRLRCLQRSYRCRGSEAARKAMYLAVRDKYNTHDSSRIETAAQFIFLNRTCFNGLYRVNSNGQYNVAFGKAENPLICDEDTIRADSVLLQRVNIISGDFLNVVKCVQGEAFFYLDPPYRPLTKSACFTAYTKDGFGDLEQKKLALFCRDLDSRGVRWLLTNSDPHNVNPSDMFFERLYEGYDIRRVHATRMINSNAEGRGKIKELVIRNYTS